MKDRDTSITLKFPPRFTIAALGPGLVLIAMGLGAGEYILWPYMVAQFGFGIIWGAILGVAFQFLLSNESGRYTLYTGSSIYVAFARIFRFAPIWFITSTLLSFAWPGIIGSGGAIIAYLFGIDDVRLITVALLVAIGLALTFGGRVYDNLERLQKVIIIISIPIIFVISIIVINPEVILAMAKGTIGLGENYFLIPANIEIISFLGAMAYAGAAGNLILSHSFYIQDKGFGAAFASDSQIDFQADTKESSYIVNNILKPNPINNTQENVSIFKSWMRYTFLEQFLTFFLVGVGAIFLLASISYSLVYPYNGEEGLNFLFLQSEKLTENFGALTGIFILIVGVLFLITTQLGIFETTSRIMTENLQIFSKRIQRAYSRKSLFFFFLWLQILIAIIITFIGIDQPIQLLLTSTFFSAISMLVISIFILILNYSQEYPLEYRAGKFKMLIVLLGLIFYSLFTVLTIADIFT